MACKYAATGDPAYRQQSEEMLAKAKQMSADDQEALASLAEFEERNRYRLESREIITKAEYDRRFRAGKTTAK